MPELQFKYALYGLVSLFLVSVGGNAWSVYKMSSMQDTISEQLDGKLSETAQQIASINTELGTVKSNMDAISTIKTLSTIQ